MESSERIRPSRLTLILLAIEKWEMIARGKGMQMQICMRLSVKEADPFFLFKLKRRFGWIFFSCLKVEARYVGFSQMKNVPSARQKCAAIQVAIDKAATEQVCLVLEATPLLLFWCHLWVVTLEGLTGVVCE